jgi:hypothetical protein
MQIFIVIFWVMFVIGIYVTDGFLNILKFAATMTVVGPLSLFVVYYGISHKRPIIQIMTVLGVIGAIAYQDIETIQMKLNQVGDNINLFINNVGEDISNNILQIKDMDNIEHILMFIVMVNICIFGVIYYKKTDIARKRKKYVEDIRNNSIPNKHGNDMNAYTKIVENLKENKSGAYVGIFVVSIIVLLVYIKAGSNNKKEIAMEKETTTWGDASQEFSNLEKIMEEAREAMKEK